MPIENPSPGKYWGFYCVNCGKPIAITEVYKNARVPEDLLPLCLNADCGYEAEYRSANVRVLALLSVSDFRPPLGRPGRGRPRVTAGAVMDERERRMRARNRALVSKISGLASARPVAPTDTLGVPTAHVESMAFAWLAMKCVRREPVPPPARASPNGGFSPTLLVPLPLDDATLLRR